MPIYAYECQACKASVEFLQKTTDKRKKKKCPVCKKRKLVRIIGNTSFVLKGGGWYADGYTSSTKTE